MKQPARHPDCHNDYVNGSVALLLTVQSLSAQADTVGAEFGWDGRRVRHLLDRYGSEIHTLMALCREQADLAEPLQHAPDYLRQRSPTAARMRARCTWRTCSPTAPG